MENLDGNTELTNHESCTSLDLEQSKYYGGYQDVNYFSPFNLFIVENQFHFMTYS